jgi:hypothetical protein
MSRRRHSDENDGECPRSGRLGRTRVGTEAGLSWSSGLYGRNAKPFPPGSLREAWGTPGLARRGCGGRDLEIGGLPAAPVLLVVATGGLGSSMNRPLPPSPVRTLENLALRRPSGECTAVGAATS